ncbi:hypothetical protein ACMFMG_002215 [Clarireedia jacksonii]
MLDGLSIIKRDGGRIFDGKKGERDSNEGLGNKHGGDDEEHDSIDDDYSSRPPPPLLVSTTTRWLTQPASTVVIMQTSMIYITPTTSSTSPTSSISMSTSATLSSISTSSSISVTTSVLSTITAPPTSTNAGGAGPKKESCPDDNPACSITKTVSGSAAPTAQSDESAPSSNQLSSNHHGNNYDDDSHDGGISPITEKLLISAGSIGIFVIIAAIIYLVIRMKKLNRLAKGDFSKYDRAWYGRRRSREGSNRPPSYSSDRMSPDRYAIDEKFGEREIGGYYGPESKRPFSRAGTAPIQVRTDLQRQPSSSRSNHSAHTMSNSPIVGPSPTNALQNNADFYYFQAGTLRSQQSGQSSNAYDPTQREVNRVSYLSSISSGFGDQLIMPEGGPLPQIPVSRFSWTTASQTQNNRDTIYTTTSEETAPRFRTVNSWVAQQTGRVERRQQTNQEIPAMPEIPASYNAAEVPEPFSAERHQRNLSENPVFKYHPGEQIEFQSGARVPSEILDRKIGI